MTTPATIRCGTRVAVLLAIAAVGSCSRPPLEFADWIVEVPEGTRVIEYAPVPIEERDPDAIRLTEELALGADLDNADSAVFRASYVAGTEDGVAFVADAAMNRVQMFDARGRFVRTLGREGQGPGEFGDISGLTIAGELLVVDDRANDRFSTWTLQGEHARDHRRASALARSVGQTKGLADGSMVGRAEIWAADAQRVETQLIGRFSLDSRELARFDSVTPGPPIYPDRTWTSFDLGQAIIGMFDDPRRAFAVGARQFIYLSTLQEYQVTAHSSSGEMRWALRVAMQRPPVPEHVKRTVIRQARPEDRLTQADLDWPADYSPLMFLLADGSGRVYAVHEVNDEAAERIPADVYSSDGDLLAAGFIPAAWPDFAFTARRPWAHAAGEYVYGLRENDAGETVAVRYTLIVTER